MTRRATWALGLFAAAGWAGPAGADPASGLIEVIGERRSTPAAAAIKVLRKKPCGTKDDLHFCGSFTSPVYPGKNTGTVVSPALKLKAAKGDTVLVTWTGSVYCAQRFAPPFGGASEYIVSMQIQNEWASTIEYNGDGVSTIGRKTLNRGETDERTDEFYDLSPVTLTRTFEIKNSGETSYFATFDFELRSYSASCNVNGGGMTAVVVR